MRASARVDPLYFLLQRNFFSVSNATQRQQNKNEIRIERAVVTITTTTTAAVARQKYNYALKYICIPFWEVCEFENVKRETTKKKL